MATASHAKKQMAMTLTLMLVLDVMVKTTQGEGRTGQPRAPHPDGRETDFLMLLARNKVSTDNILQNALRTSGGSVKHNLRYIPKDDSITSHKNSNGSAGMITSNKLSVADATSSKPVERATDETTSAETYSVGAGSLDNAPVGPVDRLKRAISNTTSVSNPDQDTSTSSARAVNLTKSSRGHLFFLKGADNFKRRLRERLPLIYSLFGKPNFLDDKKSSRSPTNTTKSTITDIEIPSSSLPSPQPATLDTSTSLNKPPPSTWTTPLHLDSAFIIDCISEGRTDLVLPPVGGEMVLQVAADLYTKQLCCDRVCIMTMSLPPKRALFLDFNELLNPSDNVFTLDVGEGDNGGSIMVSTERLHGDVIPEAYIHAGQTVSFKWHAKNYKGQTLSLRLKLSLVEESDVPGLEVKYISPTQDEYCNSVGAVHACACVCVSMC